jgi:hypothetical protein
MLMDFDPGVRAVASQPFWLRWRDEDDHVRRLHRVIGSPAGFQALNTAAKICA